MTLTQKLKALLAMAEKFEGVRYDVQILVERQQGQLATDRRLLAGVTALQTLMEGKFMTILELLTQIETEAGETNAGVDSAIVALRGVSTLVQQLRDELAALGASPEVLAKVEQLKTMLDSKQVPLAEAIAATPQPTPPVEPPVE